MGCCDSYDLAWARCEVCWSNLVVLRLEDDCLPVYLGARVARVGMMCKV